MMIDIANIIQDFERCGCITDCEKCAAYNLISNAVSDDGQTNFCELLRKYNADLLNKVERVFSS